MSAQRSFVASSLRRRATRRSSQALPTAVLLLLILTLLNACAPAATQPAPTAIPSRAAKTVVVAPTTTVAAARLEILGQAPLPNAAPTNPYCCSTGGTDPVNGEPYDANFFENYGVNPFIDTEDDHLSTFGMDVDTASYSVVRRFLEDGNWPDKDAVRTEEILNYFKWNYPQPDEEVFGINLEGAPSPFGGEKYWLVKIGLQGRRVDSSQRPDAMLTFVIDVSGSMQMENRLELVKRSLRLLVEELRPSDRVAIVVYGSQARQILEPTSARNADTILAAIEELRPEDSTNAEAGLRLAYEIASEAFQEGGINRLILCSDGVANVGRTGPDEILGVIERFARRNISLSTVGFGMGNYNDVLMEQLADKGNGAYAYVDTLSEARRVFVENLTGTLQTIAKDAKVQVEFDPQVVSRYRLLGYENRDIADQDFRDDKVDAGEVGAGHSVTALYEIKFHDDASAGQALTVRIRYQDTDSEAVIEQEAAFSRGDFAARFEQSSSDFKLATVVAEYAEILRRSYWAKESRMRDVLDLIEEHKDSLPSSEETTEFIVLVRRAVSLER